MSQANVRADVNSVALPSEHGGWSFLLEPLVLGLLVAGSPMGWVLAGAALCAFLAHQPLKIVLKDRLKGRRPPRTVLAERFLARKSSRWTARLARLSPSRWSPMPSPCTI
ncbi:MAG: YwiC-like family protein [Anaerolineae bacterium]|nr:YwiC-like family protein [Anaerolineae bacterium]